MHLALILSVLAAFPNDVGLSSAAGAGEVFACGFEDAADRDYDGWPDQWIRGRSRELPEFLRIGIVPEPGGTGTPPNHCLQIELDGGGAIVSSPPVAISSHFSYVVSLRIKAAGLKHDGARATLSLQGADGHEVQSEASLPLTAAADWQVV